MVRLVDWPVDENCEPRDWKDEDANPDCDPETVALPTLRCESPCSCEESWESNEEKEESNPDSFSSKDSPGDVVASEELRDPTLNL